MFSERPGTGMISDAARRATRQTTERAGSDLGCGVTGGDLA